MNKALAIKNVHIFSEETEITDGFLLSKDGKITKIGTAGDWIKEQHKIDMPVIDGKGLYAIPGFIDGHIHGAGGADVMDATETALDTMSAVLPAEGTTSFLATTITQSRGAINDALANVACYRGKRGQAEIVGIHLEGPFIEEKKAGAQPKEFILAPEVEQFEKWQRLADGRIKTVTMAPEKDKDKAVIRYLAAQGINVSAGHTDAGITVMKQAVEAGLRQVTHLCNAMSGIHHRDIGVTGAAFMQKELKAELIADGIHVSEEMIELIYHYMGSERLLLITDAIRAKCLASGTYDLGGQEVSVTKDRAVLRDGTLAGSVLKMLDGVKKMTAITSADMRDIIQMTAVNPAKQIGLFDRKGSLKEGKDADILLVDDQWNIHYTICQGETAFERGDGQ